MYQSNQTRAIISLGFPREPGDPQTLAPSREQYPRYCSTAGTVARQPPSLPPPQSSQSHLPPSPCATTAPRSRRARIILRPSSHAYNLRPRLGRDPIPIMPRATGDSLPAAVGGALVPGVQHARVVGDLFLEREKSSHCPTSLP